MTRLLRFAAEAFLLILTGLACAAVLAWVWP